MKHVRNIVRILLTSILSFGMRILALVVVPIALVGLDEDDTQLPDWARMWETYDNDINGDIYWKEHHAKGKERTYWWRLKWLLRNPAGTFAYEKLGMPLTQHVEYKVWGDVMTSNRNPAHAGFMYAEASYIGGKTYPCYYWVYQWGNSKRCFRVYLGWKFRHSRPLEDWPKEEKMVQFVSGANPLMGFE